MGWVIFWRWHLWWGFIISGLLWLLGRWRWLDWDGFVWSWNINPVLTILIIWVLPNVEFGEGNENLGLTGSVELDFGWLKNVFREDVVLREFRGCILFVLVWWILGKVFEIIPYTFLDFFLIVFFCVTN